MDKVTCKCGHSFSFADGVKKKWKDGFMEWHVTCPECKETEYVCKLSKNTVRKRQLMIRLSKRYQSFPIPENKKRYMEAVGRYQKSFDKDNVRHESAS